MARGGFSKIPKTDALTFLTATQRDLKILLEALPYMDRYNLDAFLMWADGERDIDSSTIAGWENILREIGIKI